MLKLNQNLQKVLFGAIVLGLSFKGIEAAIFFLDGLAVLIYSLMIMV